MGLLKLVLIEYKENIGKAIILIAVSTIVTITGLFWLAQRGLVYGSVDIFRAYGLSGKVLVYNGIFVNDEDMIQLERDIESLPCAGEVDNCGFYGIYTNVCEYMDEYPDDNYYSFDIFMMPVVNSNPYRMVEGRAPFAPNEIMISSNIRGIGVGDYLHDYCYTDRGASKVIKIDDVLVTGIFELNNPLPLDLNKSFYGEYEMYSDNSPETLQKTGFAFCTSIIDENGNEIKPSHLGHAVMISPAEGFSDADVVRSLSQELGIDSAYDITRFTQYAEEYHEDELLLFRTMTLVLSVVLLTVNIAYCFIGLFIKKRELAVYHVFGMPWKTTVRLYSFMYLIFVVIGYIIGLLLYIGQASFIKDIAYQSYYFSPVGAVLLGIIIVGVYSLVNLVFYIVTSGKTPIFLLRRE